MRALLRLLLGVALVSCGGESVSLTVSLQTDLEPETDFSEVTVELRESAEAAGPTLRESVVRLERSTAGLSTGVPVAEFVELVPGDYRVTVRLGGAMPRRRDVLVALSTSREVRVAIARSCDGVSCPPAGAPGRTECADGVCVDPACVDSSDPACGGTCEARERDCSDGRDEDCDGLTDCADPECADTVCDDSDACTFDDLCAAGVCAGVEVVCVDDECSTSTCDGTATCVSNPRTAGTACGDDDNACTRDECDGAGACAHPPAPAGAPCPADTSRCTLDECDGSGACAHPAVPDGTPWPGGEFALCCGGVETQLNTRENCGGCGVACPGSRACVEVQFPDFPAHPACECSTADPVCPGPQFCNGFINHCFCRDDGECPAGQRCAMMPLPPSSNTHNYCWY